MLGDDGFDLNFVDCFYLKFRLKFLFLAKFEILLKLKWFKSCKSLNVGKIKIWESSKFGKNRSSKKLEKLKSQKI